MSNHTLNVLLKDYEQKRYMADLSYEKEKSNFYNSHPELSELNAKLAKLALDISKSVLNSKTEVVKKLRLDYDKLKKEKDSLLNTLDIPKRCSFSLI